MIYKIGLPASTDPYTVTAPLSDLSVDLDVFLLSTVGCNSGQCLTGSSYGNSSTTVNNVSAGDYYIVVDGYVGAEGSYTLTVSCDPYPRIYLPIIVRK